MATFSLEDYQRILNELTSEIESYGSARRALERTTSALEALAEGSGQLYGSQALLMNEVAASTERIAVLVSAVDVAAQQSDSVFKQLRDVQDGLNRQTEDLISRLTALSDQTGVQANGLKDEISGLRSAYQEADENLDAKLQGMADQLTAINASIDASNAIAVKTEDTIKQLVGMGFGVLGLLVVLILLIVGLVY